MDPRRGGGGTSGTVNPVPPPHPIPPFSTPHVPNPVPPSFSGGTSSVIPPGSGPVVHHQPQALGMGHFGTGINPPPFQPPPPIPSSQPPDKGVASISWGPDSTTASSPSHASVMKGLRDGVSVVSEMRPLRIDPRTKYSQFKIKPKGSPSSSSSVGGAQSILKGKESDGMSAVQNSASGERTHMPRLLQEPPPLQRPFDPQELFDSAASKDVPADYQVSGPFGSTFGSYFTRSSEAAEAASSNAPYGEITMTTAGTDAPSAEGSPGKAKSTESQEMEKEVVKSDETKKVVPSYLAELGVGLGGDDLTIDSAFSSLDNNGGKGENNGGLKETVTAKSLPSIFGFGSGTSS